MGELLPAWRRTAIGLGHRQPRDDARCIAAYRSMAESRSLAPDEVTEDRD